MGNLIQPVILSGGAGTRLWPVSRELHPKQLLNLTGQRTMIQETARRTADATRFTPPVIVCNADHRFMIEDQLREAGLKPRDVLIEPVARNTAAAVAAAALYVRQHAPEQMLLIMPSDHLIQNTVAFAQALTQGIALAETGHIVTFGVTPNRPETGYGYIKQGSALEGQGYNIASFVEKPDRSTAAAYLASGDYLWNSGIFLARADRLITEFEQYAPAVLDAAEAALLGAKRDLTFTRLAEAPFREAPALPFDKAVMEKTSHGAVVPVDIGWSDIGTWHSLWQASTRDENDNVLVGDVHSEDTHGCYIRSEKLLTATLGVENMAIVVTDDAVLVAPRERSAELGKLVENLRRKDRSETRLHNVVYRPWGHYEALSAGSRFQVKRITVRPGGQLSLQKHFHRAEHWTVVEGTAQVTVGDKVTLLSENQSVYVPLGEVHRLENPGKVPVVLIEVQSGTYLGEDDIVRLEDVYARTDEKVKV